MMTSFIRTITTFCSGALLLMGLILFGFWGPQNGLLHDAYRAESERLYQAISAPLARAVAQGDDLLRMDELRRIQKFPGVISAKVEETTALQEGRSTLVWAGKTIGTLEIRLLPTRWRFWKYRWWERALSLAIIFVLLAAIAGYFFHRAQIRHRLRVVSILRRQSARMTRGHQKDKTSIYAERQRWLAQAMEWTPQGLLALDDSQRLVMANTRGLHHFKLDPQALGGHWLDHQGSPEWAAALCRSVDSPGQTIAGPSAGDGQRTRLHTTPESTWIIISQSEVE